MRAVGPPDEHLRVSAASGRIGVGDPEVMEMRVVAVDDRDRTFGGDGAALLADAEVRDLHAGGAVETEPDGPRRVFDQAAWDGGPGGGTDVDRDGRSVARERPFAGPRRGGQVEQREAVPVGVVLIEVRTAGRAESLRHRVESHADRPGHVRLDDEIHRRVLELRLGVEVRHGRLAVAGDRRPGQLHAVGDMVIGGACQKKRVVALRALAGEVHLNPVLAQVPGQRVASGEERQRDRGLPHARPEVADRGGVPRDARPGREAARRRR